MAWRRTAAAFLSIAAAGGCASAGRGGLAGLPGEGPLLAASPAALPGGEAELPPVEVKGSAEGDERLVGENSQPVWTTRRPFARSRVYVLAPWQVEGELWYRGKYDGGDTSSQLWQTELGVGLPHRLQVDYYQNFTDAPGAGARDAGPQVEARWALAKWGAIPLNPTVYGEYRWDTTGADKVEAKLLLGDTLAPRWHGAANVIWEQETSGARATELGLSGALSWSVLPGRASIGVEATVTRVTGDGARDRQVWEVALGPSVQLRLSERTHLDVVPMCGLNERTHDLDLFVVLGYDFGGGDEGRLVPVARKSQ